MFVMENDSVAITVVTDTPQTPWKNRLKIAKNHKIKKKKKIPLGRVSISQPPQDQSIFPV
jgi:hypothetical protein